MSGIGARFAVEISVRDAPARRLYASGISGGQEGPAAGGEADGEGAEEAGALGALEIAPLSGGHKGAKGLETVGGDEAAGDEVPQAALNVGGEAAAGAGDVVVEEGAAGGEEVEDVAAGAGDGGGRRKGE